MTERTDCADGDAEDVLAVAHNAALTCHASLNSRSYRTDQNYHQMCDHFREPLPEEGQSGIDVIAALAERADSGPCAWRDRDSSAGSLVADITLASPRARYSCRSQR